MLKLFLKNSFIFWFLITGIFCSAENITIGKYNNCSSDEVNIAPYSGNIYIKEPQNKYLILDIDEYLSGVVSGEMGEDSPYEAFKAQAVVSRTYLLFTSKKNKQKGLPYDIENSIYNQVHKVCKSEKIRNAVDETKDEILTFNGEIVEIFFHACCGGKTTSPSSVWGGNYNGSINGIIDDYCEGTPYYSWEKKYSSDYLSDIFKLYNIDKIEIVEKDASGRVKNLNLITKGGKVMQLSGHKFRLKILSALTKVSFDNPSNLPSTMFDVEKKDNDFIFRGNGYGHGVGLCQWGAKKMAESGKNYREILKFFFPDMEIISLEGGENEN